MNLEEFQFELEERVLEYILENNLDIHINRAKQIFFNNLEMEKRNISNMDFNTWLIYDYKYFDDKTFIDEFYLNRRHLLSLQEREVLEKIVDTYPSIYEYKELKNNNGLFKDIFTRKEFLISEEGLSELRYGDIIFSRVINTMEGIKFFGNKVLLPGFFKSSIERNMIPQYEKYTNQIQFSSWDDFLNNNRLLLYKFVDIALEVLNNQLKDDDEYQVWQSVYLVKDFNAIKDLLKEDSIFVFDNKDEGYLFYKVIKSDRILAEFVLTKQTAELECNSDIDREKAKSIITSSLGELLIHYKDEVIGLNDIT